MNTCKVVSTNPHLQKDLFLLGKTKFYVKIYFLCWTFLNDYLFGSPNSFSEDVCAIVHKLLRVRGFGFSSKCSTENFVFVLFCGGAQNKFWQDCRLG